MELYAGMDLHSTNTYVGILNVGLERVFKKRVRNDLGLILETFEPFRKDLQGIVVESTYNWYWLVDGLMDAGYRCVHLANPSAIQQYEGLKYSDDNHDAFWLARLMSLGILPEGYIYPKEDRPVRDLLRKRSFMVRQRTEHIHSLQSMIERHTARRLKGNEVKNLETENLWEMFEHEYSTLAADADSCVIKFLTEHIERIEKAVLEKAKLKEPFERLLTVPGIGKILALTIMLEVGDIGRFPEVGNFVSYARCAPSCRISNSKKKGEGNRKNGNKYLGWAFVEASNFARRFYPKFRSYYQHKASKSHPFVATKAICNKLARICYYVMKDRVCFREEAIFC